MIPMKLHEWLFTIIDQICIDQDYKYLFFFEHFTKLLSEIIKTGSFVGEGIYLLSGIKTGVTIKMLWKLDHQINWMGPNILTISCQSTSEMVGFDLDEKPMKFDLSTGNRVDDTIIH